jgi:phage-related protein
VPLSISSVATAEKNKITANSVWLIALEITIPGYGGTICIVANNEDIWWAGSQYTAASFQVDQIGEESKGEVPRVDIRISNISRVMDSVVQQYDAYVKVNGYSPVMVNIYLLNSLNLGSATPEVKYVFELKQPKTSPMWATFTLGAPNPFMRRYPESRMLKHHCRHIFTDENCKHPGDPLGCNKTLVRCRALGNRTNFGGFPGIGRGGLTLV